MKAPATVVPPQTSAPSQKRQVGARRKISCQESPSATRLAERPPWSQPSHTLRKARGAETAMKSRFDGSLPKRPHGIGASDAGRAAEIPQGRQVERVEEGAHVELIGHFLAADHEARDDLVALAQDGARIEHLEEGPGPVFRDDRRLAEEAAAEEAAAAAAEGDRRAR